MVKGLGPFLLQGRIRDFRTVMETEVDTLTSGASCSVFSGCGSLGLTEDQQCLLLSKYSLPPW